MAISLHDIIEVYVTSHERMVSAEARISNDSGVLGPLLSLTASVGLSTLRHIWETRPSCLARWSKLGLDPDHLRHAVKTEVGHMVTRGCLPAEGSPELECKFDDDVAVAQACD